MPFTTKTERKNDLVAAQNCRNKGAPEDKRAVNTGQLQEIPGK